MLTMLFLWEVGMFSIQICYSQVNDLPLETIHLKTGPVSNK
jgi:hypothetical protein